MRRNAQMLKSILLALLTLAASLAGAKGIDERKWILVETDNFSIHSTMSERSTVKLLNYLEALRSVLIQSESDLDAVTEKPTVIVVLDKASDFESLGFPDYAAGMFITELRQNFILMSNRMSSESTQVVLHEYVHFVMLSTSRFPYPRWWSEGFAEYVSSSSLSPNGFSMGMPLEVRLRTLDYDFQDWLPWSEVIDPVRYADYSHQELAMFYAQSWLLVHYLENRRTKPHSLLQSWRIYLEEVQSGSSEIAAFEKAFELPLDDLKSKILAYNRKGRYNYLRIPVKDVLDRLSPAVSSIDRNEVQTLLGQVALRREETEQARSWFSMSLEASPDNTEAMVGLARAHVDAGAYDQAEKYFRLALDKAPEDPMALVEYARFLLIRATDNAANTTAAEDFASAEGMLVKAKGLATSTVEIDTYLAYAYMNQEKETMQAAQLLAGVVRRSPADPWPVVLLAQLFQREGLNDNAIAMANLVLQREHAGTSNSKAAATVISEIESAQVENAIP